MPVRRMRHHPGRLVQTDKILIFIHKRKFSLCRQNLSLFFLPFMQMDFHLIALLHRMCHRDPLCIEQNPVLLALCMRNLSPGEIQLLPQDLLNTLPVLFFSDRVSELLIRVSVLTHSTAFKEVTISIFRIIFVTIRFTRRETKKVRAVAMR